MMDWHCANKRKRRPVQLASVEPYLGDVVGELPPMRPTYRRDYSPPDWVKRGVNAIVTTFGVTTGAVILVAVVLSFFVAASHGAKAADIIARKVFVAAMYGQGGQVVDAALGLGSGVDRVCARIRVTFGHCQTYNWNQASVVAAKIKALPAGAIVVVGPGASLGGNEGPRVGALVSGRRIDLMVGIQPSLFGVRNLVTPNVKRAVFFYNPMVWMTGGLGAYQWQRAPGNRSTTLVQYSSYLPHPGDNADWIHDIILAEIKKLLK